MFTQEPFESVGGSKHNMQRSIPQRRSLACLRSTFGSEHKG